VEGENRPFFQYPHLASDLQKMTSFRNARWRIMLALSCERGWAKCTFSTWAVSGQVFVEAQLFFQDRTGLAPPLIGQLAPGEPADDQVAFLVPSKGLASEDVCRKYCQCEDLPHVALRAADKG
jgi:hypothetical protein